MIYMKKFTREEGQEGEPMETTIRPSILRQTTEQSFSKSNLFFTGFLAILFLVFPYWSGLFFPVATAVSGVYVALIALMIALWGITRQVEVTNFAKLDLLALLYSLIVLCSVFTYANLEFTLTGIAKQFAFLFFYLAIRLSMANGLGVRVFLWIVFLSSAVYSLYGLLLGFNVLTRTGGLFDQRRIASAFEYPNSFASYLTIGLLFGLVLQVGMKRWWTRFAVLSLNTLTLMTLILTNSRGGWLVFLGVQIVTILFAPQGRRAGLTLNSLATVLAMGAGLPLTNSAVQSVSLDKGLLGLGISLGVALVLAVVLERLVVRVNGLHLKMRVVLPILLIVAVTVGFAALKLGLLPENIAQRISSINFQQFSVVQRFIFYKDGLSALMDHPLVGAGDKTWEVLFSKYQSYPYYTTNPHSVLVDQAMNTGLLGLGLFLATIVLTGLSLWKWRREQRGDDALISTVMLGGLLALVGHSLIDVDFSYAVFGYLFWMLVAVAANRQPLSLKVPSFMGKMNWKPRNRWIWWAGALLSLVVAGFSGSYVYADSLVKQAKEEAKEPEVALKTLDKAVKIAPYMPGVHSMQAELEERIFTQTNNPMYRSNVQFRLQKLPALTEQPELLIRVGQKLVKHQKTMEGYALVKQAWQNAPYYAEYGEQFIIYAVQIGNALVEQKHPEQAREYYQDAIRTHEEILERIEGFKDLPSVLFLERKYEVTPRMKEFLSIAYYRLDQFAKAEQLATEALQAGEGSHSGQVVAVQLAAQIKQGKQPDQTLLNSVMNTPGVSEHYAKLVHEP
jgi:hypothetical protein